MSLDYLLISLTDAVVMSLQVSVILSDSFFLNQENPQ
jgi:hypothetical protein